jgi:hypothetical protein
MGNLVGVIAGPLFDLIGKYFPSEEEKNKAKLAILEAEQNGNLEEVKVQLSAIVAEANSADPWTSRARPSFLYVVYICILFGLPMGMLSAYSPETAAHIATGFGLWLKAIPDSMWTLFGVGYLGYVGARSYDKKNGVAS